MAIAAHGIELELPAGWDGRIYGRPRAAAALPSPEAALPGYRGAVALPPLATAHAASFPLTGAEGDFGGSATMRMPDRAAFISLVEYEPDAKLTPGVGLFESLEIPRAVTPEDFRGETMMVRRRDQAGLQRFFTAGARPFCLYAVIGSRRHAGAIVPAINRVLAQLVIV